MLWESDKWLHNNYKTNNGLPAFFVEGGYSFDEKNDAIYEFKEAVENAIGCDDAAFSNWASEVKAKGFYILESDICVSFWNGMLISENRENAYRANNETQYPQKRRRLIVVCSFNSPFTNRDIKYDKYSLSEEEEQEVNFEKMLRKNHIEYNEDEEYCLKSSLQLSKIAVECGKIMKRKHTNPKKALKLIKLLQENDPQIITSVYQIILELHIFDRFIFDSSFEPFLNEANLVVKVWGPLFEKCFRQSGIILQWGAIHEDIGRGHSGKKTRAGESFVTSKLCLRVIAWEPIQNTVNGVAINEFSRKTNQPSYFYVLNRAVLCAKVFLNKIINRCPHIRPSEIEQLSVPFVLIMGFESQVFVLKMKDPKVYVLKRLFTVRIPQTIEDLETGINTLLSGVLFLKKLCLKLNMVVNDLAKK